MQTIQEQFPSIPTADSADNVRFTDVIGNKSDTVAGTSSHAILKRIEAALGGAAVQLRVEQSNSGVVEEDAIVAFAISLVDVDAGAIVSANIDITGISATMEKSTGGGAFSVSGITQPTFGKADGLVSVDYRFLLAEWEIGDVYKLSVSGITVTIDSDTAYVKTCIWSNVVLEEQNVEAKIDDIPAETNAKTFNATALASIEAECTDAIEAGDLDHFLLIDGATQKYPENCATDSILAKILVKADPAVPSQFDNSTDSLEAIRDAIDANQTDLDAVIADLTTAVTEPPTAKSLHDILHKDGSYTYDNETDSLEAIADSVASGTLEIEADAGTTSTNIIDAAALTHGTDDWFVGATLVSINGQNTGQARPIVSFDAATDSVDVFPAFLNTPDAGDDFLLITSWRPHVLDQQPDVAVSVAANIAAVDIFDLNTAGVSYMVNSLLLKAVDPGAETITVTLKELINDVSTAVDTFVITTANFGTYFSLYDMFSRHHLAGDDIQVTIQASADNAYAITGQYQYAQAYTG